MSKGIGKLQRDVMAILTSPTWRAEERISLTHLLPQYKPSAVHRAVESLRERGLVRVERFMCRGGRQSFSVISAQPIVPEIIPPNGR